MTKQASRIANDIVDLVERTDRAVTLARIEREVPGFASKDASSWEYVVEDDAGEMVVWDGLTEAGLAALRNVVAGRKVAVQLVNALPYMLEGSVLKHEDWMPIVLLPVKAANLETPTWLMRCPLPPRDLCVATAAVEGRSGYLSLDPPAARCKADEFSA